MTDKCRKVYEGSIKNEQFLDSIYSADHDKKPSWFSSNNDKVIFATIYYGWLVGKYGNEWEKYI